MIRSGRRFARAELLRYHRVEYRLRCRQHVFGNGSASVGLGIHRVSPQIERPRVWNIGRRRRTMRVFHPRRRRVSRFRHGLGRRRRDKDRRRQRLNWRRHDRRRGRRGHDTRCFRNADGLSSSFSGSFFCGFLGARRSLRHAAAQAFDRRTRQIVGVRSDRGFSRRNGDWFGDHRLGGRRRNRRGSGPGVGLFAWRRLMAAGRLHGRAWGNAGSLGRLV